MDLFGGDIDSFMQEDELNDNIREEDVENADGEEQEGDEKQQTDENGEPIKVEPKKRSVRKPQLRLNVERLKSDRGVHTIEKYFNGIKFRGKGYERDDLNMVMKKMEHWAHRCYPAYTFDDFIAQVEKLGRKKEMQTHMYRYRHGLLEDVATRNEVVETNEHMESGSQMEGFEPIDELDEIIDQQIQNYTMAPRTPAHDRTFDSIRSSIVATPRLREQNPIQASTPFVPRIEEPSITSMAAPCITSEQMARIAENRRLAQERLRLKKLEAQTESMAVSAPTVE